MDEVDKVSSEVRSRVCEVCQQKFEDLDADVVRSLYYGHMRRKHSDY